MLSIECKEIQITNITKNKTDDTYETQFKCVGAENIDQIKYVSILCPFVYSCVM